MRQSFSFLLLHRACSCHHCRRYEACHRISLPGVLCSPFFSYLPSRSRRSNLHSPIALSAKPTSSASATTKDVRPPQALHKIFSLFPTRARTSRKFICSLPTPRSSPLPASTPPATAHSKPPPTTTAAATLILLQVRIEFTVTYTYEDAVRTANDTGGELNRHLDPEDFWRAFRFTLSQDDRSLRTARGPLRPPLRHLIPTRRHRHPPRRHRLARIRGCIIRIRPRQGRSLHPRRPIRHRQIRPLQAPLNHPVVSLFFAGRMRTALVFALVAAAS